jgi:hypothetical protein
MKLSLVLILVFSVQTVFPQNVQWTSVIQAGHTCTSIETDDDNNVYSAGEFYSKIPATAVFNDSVFRNTAETNAYIAKTDDEMNILWLKVIESSWATADPVVGVDRDKNVIVALAWYDDLRFDSVVILDDKHDRHGLIVKFDSIGNLLWYNLIKTTDFVFINDISVDAEDNIWITGCFNGGMTVESADSVNVNLFKGGQRTGFVVKYAPSGNLAMAKSIESQSSLSIESIAVDTHSNIFLTGWFAGEANWGNYPASAYHTDVFLVCYNSAMELEWFRQMGAEQNSSILESGRSLAFDQKQENIYVTGSVRGNADFGGGTITVNDKNIFLAKYSVGGQLKWAKTMGSWSGVASYVETGIDVVADKNDNVFLLGDYMWQATIGDTIISIPHDNNEAWTIFIARFDANGGLSWVQQPGSKCPRERKYMLACNSQHLIYTGGVIQSGSLFGDIPYMKTEDMEIGGFIATLKDNEQATSVQELTFDDELKLVVSPNPFSSSFIAELVTPEGGLFEIQLSNNQGVVVYNQQVMVSPGSTVTVNSGDIPAGTYITSFVLGKKSFRRKLIKVK